MNAAPYAARSVRSTAPMIWPITGLPMATSRSRKAPIALSRAAGSSGPSEAPYRSRERCVIRAVSDARHVRLPTRIDASLSPAAVAGGPRETLAEEHAGVDGRAV